MDQALYEELLTTWQPQQNLPAQIGEFILREPTPEERQEYVFFAYTHPQKNWHFRCLHSAETYDYMIKYDIGLMVITDIRFIRSDANEFWELIQNEWKDTIEKRWLKGAKTSSRIIQKTGIICQEFSDVFPTQLGAFKRKIDPLMPVEGLNGSYIIAAYADEKNDKGILFFYNTFRADYFAEMRLHQVPIMIHDFDAKSPQELQEKVKDRLADVLEELSKA